MIAAGEETQVGSDVSECVAIGWGEKGVRWEEVTA